MNPAPRNRWIIAVAGLAAAVSITTACAPADDDDDAGSDTTVTPTDGTDSSASSDPCAIESLNLQTPGSLTIGTDSPAYPPWFEDDDPTNGKGFESAVAYAVATEMGFTEDQVQWVQVPFNKSYAPGPKNFDFDINQISITPKRAEAVDFSQGYYSADQAVVTMKKSGLDATSLADLKDAKLGAQIGTTSLLAAQETIKPTTEVAVYDDTNAAKQALLNGQIDAIIVDLPTAFYITAAEIPGSTILGQFEASSGAPEEFGLLFEKGNPLVTCVDSALTAMKDDGSLDQIEQEWLSQTVDVPVLE
jgi:polar amino acid transport system substrate-binding protein